MEAPRFRAARFVDVPGTGSQPFPCRLGRTRTAVSRAIRVETGTPIAVGWWRSPFPYPERSLQRAAGQEVSALVTDTSEVLSAQRFSPERYSPCHAANDHIPIPLLPRSGTCALKSAAIGVKRCTGFAPAMARISKQWPSGTLGPRRSSTPANSRFPAKCRIRTAQAGEGHCHPPRRTPE
jgi:hypothetical protein